MHALPAARKAVVTANADCAYDDKDCELTDDRTMLNALRNAARGTTAKVLLGLLILSFAVWGVSGAFTSRAANTVIAAGETIVTPNEYALAYTRAVAELGARFGTRLTNEQAQALGVEQSVVSELVAGAVLDEQARQLDLGVSEGELAKLVAEDPSFQGLDGRFDRSQFRAVLRSVNMSEEEYLDSRSAVARRLQLVDTVASEAAAPSAFQEALSKFDAQTRDITVLSLTPDILPAPAAVTDEEIAAFFEVNVQSYERPEYRTVQYAVLSPETLADPTAIADETVQAEYERDPQRFAVPASRDIQRLVFPNRDEAVAAVERIESGEITFDALLNERNADRNAILVRGATPETYPDRDAAELVFELGLNEVSEPYDTRFGTVLARPVRVFEETTQRFEDVADELRTEIAENEANSLIGEVLDSYTDERAGGATLEEAANALNLSLETIPAINARGENPEGEQVELPTPALATEVFEVEPNVETDPLPIPGGGFVLYEVTGTEAARPNTLAEVRERVVADLEAERTATALGARAAELEAALRAGRSLEEIASELGLEPQREFAVRRSAGDPARNAAVFGGPKGHVALANTGDSYDLIRVDNVATDAEVAAAEPTQITDDLFQQLVNELQREYQPTYDAALAERIRSQ